MLKKELATELRQRQYKLGQVGRDLIDVCSDEQIIDSYITCSCCGEKQVDANQLPQIITDTKNVDQFFTACDVIAKSKSNVHNCIEGILKEKGF